MEEPEPLSKIFSNFTKTRLQNFSTRHFQFDSTIPSVLNPLQQHRLINLKFPCIHLVSFNNTLKKSIKKVKKKRKRNNKKRPLH